MALACALVLSACARSPASQAADARASLASWDSTLALLGRERARGTLPEKFIAQVLRAAAQEKAGAEARLRAAEAR